MMSGIGFHKLYHYVKLEISGKHRERFLNLCRKRKYPIWDVRMGQEDVSICMRTCDYRDTFELQKRIDCQIRVTKEGGIFVFLKKYRKRECFLLGLTACLLLLWFVNGFIWKIDVAGCERLSDVQLLNWLEEHKVGLGTKKSMLSCQGIEEELRESFDEIAWTSVKLEGTKLTVEIKERLELPQTNAPDLTGSYDLVATENGVISSIYTRCGTAQVLAGDSVSKGAVLIRGSFDLVDDSGTVTSSCAVVADGDVKAKVLHDYEISIPMTYQDKIYTGRTYRTISVQIGSLRLHTDFFHKKYKATETICATRQLKLPNSFYLPVYFSETLQKEYYYKKKTYAKSQVESLANENWDRFLQKFVQKGIPIIVKNVKIVTDEKVCTLTGCVEAEESITKYKKNHDPVIQTESTDREVEN